MSGLHYYVIDTETTGLKAGYQEITEVGIIRCTDRMQLWRQVRCLYPERANIDALAVTKKTLADLEKGRSREDVVAECEKFFNEDGLTPAHRCIVAHNASFDRRFLHALWESCGREFPAHLWLDTIALTKEFIKLSGLEEQRKAQGLAKAKVNLHDACDIVGIKKFADKHDAKTDSRNTYLLHHHLINERKIDHLPFIKTAIHSIAAEDAPDLSLLDE
jgi:DNA polymerase III epsilon subunit-like protein